MHQDTKSARLIAVCKRTFWFDNEDDYEIFPLEISNYKLVVVLSLAHNTSLKQQFSQSEDNYEILPSESPTIWTRCRPLFGTQHISKTTVYGWAKAKTTTRAMISTSLYSCMSDPHVIRGDQGVS